MIDKGTFGGTPAAASMDALLNERKDAKLTKVVSKHFLRYKEGLKHLADVKDSTGHTMLLNLFFKHSLTKVDESHLPPEIASRLKNFMTAMYRKNVRRQRGDSECST